MLNKFLYFLNSLNKTLKNTGKSRKYTGKVGEMCQSKNVGTMLFVRVVIKIALKLLNLT